MKLCEGTTPKNGCGRYDAALFALPNREGAQFHTLLLVVVGLICWLSEQYFRIKVRKRMRPLVARCCSLKNVTKKINILKFIK